MQIIEERGFHISTEPSTWFRLKTGAWLAYESMKAHKLRTFLTLLGVIIGVGSVVLVGAAIEGLGVNAERTVSRAFGSESYLIAQLASPGQISRREIFEKLKRNKQIRPEDYSYLKSTTGQDVLYSPYQQKVDDVKSGDRTLEGANIIGVASALSEIRDLGIAEGRFFTDQEEQTRQQVAVIGDDFRTTFFEGLNPIGKTVKINGYDFVVVGVQERLGSSFGRSQDNSVYIPSPTFARLYGYPKSIAIFGRPRPGSNHTIEEALDITRVALRTRFRTGPGKSDPFEFLTPDSIRGFIDRVLGLISVIVVPVTMISLIIGGIGIMNIMLVSVTERTREIGIRKSLGAQSKEIMLQFLLESLMVSALGGVLGLGFAAIVCELLTNLLNADLKITLPYVFIALFVSSTVGVISGWYPAKRAASLNPIDALRTE